jgi:hypothetical protein
MARVAEWFPSWAVSHCEAIPRHDWPPFEDRYWSEFRRAFVAVGVTQIEADVATSLVARSSPGFPDRHLPAVLNAIAEHRASWVAASRPADVSCPECAGGGLTSRSFRFMHRDREVTASLACYCPCRVGRWIKGQHDGDKDLAGRILDLATLPRTVNLINPPEDWGHARTLDAVTATRDLASALALR